MPHVSSKKLSPQIWIKVYGDFIKVVLKLRTKKEVEHFIFDILTPTERIMLAKRFTLIYLLHKQEPITYVTKMLNMSSSTADRFAVKIDRGAFRNLRKIIKQSDPAFLDFLEKLLRTGMPKRGKGRWDWADKYL